MSIKPGRTGISGISSEQVMKADGNTWVVILASGDGQRLQSLTTTAQDMAVPTQYCSLQDGPSLLEEALQRAYAIASPERVCVVVAEQHRRWWNRTLCLLPADNVIVQPENRGTAVGILLPLLHILERNPQAHVVLLPSDHHVNNEGVLMRAVLQATQRLETGNSDLLLLGIEPEEADPELGYIMPGFSAGRHTFQVASFIEKPDALVAQRLIENGALWHSFIVAAVGRSLLQMFYWRYADIVLDMREAVQRLSCSVEEELLGALYARLPVLDFSRDIIEGQEANLQVLAVPPCGWADLGTSGRVAGLLRRIRNREFASQQTLEACRA